MSSRSEEAVRRKTPFVRMRWKTGEGEEQFSVGYVKYVKCLLNL